MINHKVEPGLVLIIKCSQEDIKECIETGEKRETCEELVYKKECEQGRKFEVLFWMIIL